MNLSLKDIPKKLTPLFQASMRYLTLIVIVFFVAIYSFLVIRINNLAQSEPSDDAVAEKLQTVQRPRLDQSAVNKIEQLEDQNIEVQTLFKEARQNPFSE